MTKIRIKWGVTASSGSEDVSLEDLGMTQDEWDSLSNEQKTDKLQEFLDDLPERTSIVVDEFKVVNK